MFVRLLIGRQAGQILDLPYHAATASLSMGTAEPVTDEEMQAAGIPVANGVADAEPEAMPTGYRMEPSEYGGFDIFASDGARVNEAPIPNAPAARSAAQAHVEAARQAAVIGLTNVAEPATSRQRSASRTEKAL